MAQFISEPITPEPGSFTTELMGQGLASLPAAFTWRGSRYEIVDCLEHWKESSREGGRAVGELYLRKQRFRVKLHTGQIANLYFERHARPGVSRETAKQRWFLYTLEDASAE